MSQVYKGGGNWESRPSKQPVTPTNASSPKSNTPDKLADNKVSAKAKKEFTKREDNILTGEANVTPNPKLKAKQTISLNGLGKYLSGLYYVEQVKHTFDKSGYSQSIRVTKNGFVDGVKGKEPPQTSKPQKDVVTPKVSEKVHTFRQGDSLWDIAVANYGNGNKWKDIAKANGIDTNGGERRIAVGTKIKIPS